MSQSASSVLLFVLLGICGTAVGEDPVANAQPSPAIITEHVVWRFSELVYAPPIKVETHTRAESKPNTPEFAAASQFSAIMASDLKRWSDGWDAASRAKLGLAPTTGVSPDEPATDQDWKANWRQLEQTTIYLVAKAETPDFVIIAYEIHKKESKAAVGKVLRNVAFDEDGVIRNRLCFVREGDRWLQTNQFSAHPILLLWHSGTNEVTKMGEFSSTAR